MINFPSLWILALTCCIQRGHGQSIGFALDVLDVYRIPLYCLASEERKRFPSLIALFPLPSPPKHPCKCSGSKIFPPASKEVPAFPTVDVVLPSAPIPSQLVPARTKGSATTSLATPTNAALIHACTATSVSSRMPALTSMPTVVRRPILVHACPSTIPSSAAEATMYAPIPIFAWPSSPDTARSSALRRQTLALSVPPMFWSAQEEKR